MPLCQVGSVKVTATEAPETETLYGLQLAGVPFGEDAYVLKWLDEKLESERLHLGRVVAGFGKLSSHALLAALLHCIHPRIVYWLQHLPPRHTERLAKGFDDLLRETAEKVFGTTFSEGSLAHVRLQLPVSRQGGGLRSMDALRHIAFAATCATVLPRLVKRTVNGRVDSGFCQTLEGSLGTADRFDEDRNGPVHALPLRHFLDGKLQLAVDFEAAWEACRERVGPVITGPLSVEAGAAGFHRTDDGPFGHTKLQNLVTAQCETATVEAMLARMDQMYQLDPRDPEVLAASNVDIISAQWVTSWPTAEHNLESRELMEVGAAYFGTPSVVCRPVVGQPVRLSNSKKQIKLDEHGHSLRAANMSGDGWRTFHDVSAKTLARILRSSGLTTHYEPSGVFANVVPAADNGRKKLQGITPDLMVVCKLWGDTEEMRFLDVKGLRVTENNYPTPVRRRPTRCAAVNARAEKVHPEYVASARRLDAENLRRGCVPVATRMAPVEAGLVMAAAAAGGDAATVPDGDAVRPDGHACGGAVAVDQQSAHAGEPQLLVSAGVFGSTAAETGDDASAPQDGGAGCLVGHACGGAVAVDQQSAPGDGPQHLVSAGVLGSTAVVVGGDASAAPDGDAGRLVGHACGDAVAAGRQMVPAGEPRHLDSAAVMEGSGPEQHGGTDGGGSDSQCAMEDAGASSSAADASAQPGRIGPAEALLLSYPRVQGVVFGSYSELSDCGHKLLEEAALSAAGKDFASVGARSKLEAYSFFLGHYRRTLGVVLARENARLTIHRVHVHCGARGAAALSRRDTDGHLSASRVAFDYRRGPDCGLPRRWGRRVGSV